MEERVQSWRLEGLVLALREVDGCCRLLEVSTMVVGKGGESGGDGGDGESCET